MKTKVEVTNQGITSQIARCMTCEWTNESFRSARKLGLRHARIYRHRVKIETVRATTIDGSTIRDPEWVRGR